MPGNITSKSALSRPSRPIQRFFGCGFRPSGWLELRECLDATVIVGNQDHWGEIVFMDAVGNSADFDHIRPSALAR